MLQQIHNGLTQAMTTWVQLENITQIFFDFSSAFNTIQPLRLSDKLVQMGVNVHLVSWITDYLTERPQFVRLTDCVSETVLCSTGAPQGTVLSPVLFTLYTSDFTYNTESCHIQKFSDDCCCGMYHSRSRGCSRSMLYKE